MTNGPEPFSKPLVTVMLESVVLLDDRGQPVGQHPKSTVHHTETPLHLAFSLYLFDRTGRLLMTRRALSKVTWPGVWTNSCCGHPMPGESMTDAVQHRAQDASGIWENEICPVFTATLHPAAVLQPNRAEVMDIAWIDPAAVVIASAATPFAFSPWAVEQMAGMALLPDSGMAPGTERGRGPR
jgi:isopentenyl-diphosphate delta-isomerase